MAGFFSLDEVHQLHKGISKQKPVGCASCGLSRTCRSPKMDIQGRGKIKILNWGDYPDQTEDKRGEIFAGKIGGYYKNILSNFDISTNDMLNIHSLGCRPPDNRPPKPIEIQACRKGRLAALEQNKPKAVFLLGSSSIDSYFGHRCEIGGGIHLWRGHQIPDFKNNCWVYPIYSPAYVFQNEENHPVLETLFYNDLQNALDTYKDPLPTWRTEEDCIELCFNVDKALHQLDLIQQGMHPIIAFDFETTGLRPIAKGHHIVTMSIATNAEYAFAFQMDNFQIRRSVKKILLNPNIKKIAHNIKFEDNWARATMGIPIQGWYYDTMYGTHTLDNRRGNKSLEFQAALLLGFFDFKSSTDTFLEGTDDSANSFNRIYKADMRDILKRNALDSLTEFRIALLQWEKFNQKRRR